MILVVDVSGSASAVGGVLVARLLPTLASPLVGVLADCFDRRAVLVAGDLVRAALVLGLIFARDLPMIYGSPSFSARPWSVVYLTREGHTP